MSNMLTAFNANNVVGTVILYNSTVDVLDNVSTYINQIDKLYVIDNSVVVNTEVVDRLANQPKIAYYSLKGNQGIAAAINYAARMAIGDGYSLLLTMDDDTRTPANMVNNMLGFWNKYTGRLGILSGVHHDRPSTVAYRSIQYTLTSGNLLNLDAYQEIGGFRDDFFIDHVDHEYCFRLIENSYAVIELPTIHLDHKLGITKNIRFGSIQIRTYGTNSPIRLYYYARNGLYLSKKYFKNHTDFSWIYTKEMIRRWLKTLFLDTNRLVRMRMLWKGMIDGWQGKLGKLDTNKFNHKDNQKIAG